MKVDLFTDMPNELKTIEIDVEKKVFKINGADVGYWTTDVAINVGGSGFLVYVDLYTRARFANYDMSGKKTDDRSYEKSGQ